MSGKFVDGAWVESFMPKYTVTAISKWIVSAESEEDAYKLAATLVPIECWEWEAEQRFIITRICPECKATDYRYHGIQAATSGNSNMAYCQFYREWTCNQCGHVFNDYNCDMIEEPEG